MNEHLDQEPDHPTETTPRSRRPHRLRRVLAAFLVVAGVGTGIAAAVPAAAPAGASTLSNGVFYQDCNYAFGLPSVHLGLDNSPAKGTTVAIYLWKWIVVNGTWVRQSQGLMDWAKRTDLGWGQNGVFKDGLYIMFNGHGYYFVQVAIWSPTGALVYNRYSGNNCSY